MSSFVSKHPGGVDQILCAAGRDITQVFEAYHNPEVAKYVCRLADPVANTIRKSLSYCLGFF